MSLVDALPPVPGEFLGLSQRSHLRSEQCGVVIGALGQSSFEDVGHNAALGGVFDVCNDLAVGREAEHAGCDVALKQPGLDEKLRVVTEGLGSLDFLGGGVCALCRRGADAGEQDHGLDVLGGREDESNDEAVAGQDLLDNCCSGQMGVATLGTWTYWSAPCPCAPRQTAEGCQARWPS